MLLNHSCLGLLSSSLSSVPTTSICHSWPQNFDMMLLSGYATILQDVSNIFEHLQSLFCPSHPRFLHSLMHLEIPSFRPDVSLGQFNHTNHQVEVLRYLGIYVGASIMTLGILENHLVIQPCFVFTM